MVSLALLQCLPDSPLLRQAEHQHKQQEKDGDSLLVTDTENQAAVLLQDPQPQTGGNDAGN